MPIPYKDLNSIEFENDLKSKDDIILIDCRTQREYDSGHIPSSINHDFNSGEFESYMSTQPKDLNYYIYCRSGARSAAACRILSNQGFSKLTNLQRGILEWTGDIE